MEVVALSSLQAAGRPRYAYTPHRPRFHVLIFTTAGTTSHTVDFEKHELSPGRTVWVRPAQVTSFGPEDPSFDAELVLFQPDFLIPNTEAAAAANDLVAPVVIDHPASSYETLAQARSALRDEYHGVKAAQHATALQTEALRHLLSVLILRIKADDPAPARGAGNDLYRQFRELLERDFAIAHDVAHYANALRYSARTLARATEAATGQTPKDVIQDRLVLEARRLLGHTDLPVSSIARQLGFRDPSNFSAFFTQKTGTTPTSFQRSQRPERT